MNAVLLEDYRRKRDFTRTPEPSSPDRKEGDAARRFVVQKHDATRLHYDLRLEIDGVLKSWAVPKGVPLLRGQRRLAIQVEDHPVSYLHFEGVIPRGQYGGGTVMVWDTGTFERVEPWTGEKVPKQSFHFRLHGTKLDGEWALVRLGNEGDQWLLMRQGSDAPSLPADLEETSVRSGRQMHAIGPGSGMGKGPASPVRGAARGKAAPAPPFIAPMMAKLVNEPPTGEWIYELKFDGYRALAFKSANGVKLMSRNRLDFTATFPELRNAVAALGMREGIIDGEIVALDARGRPSFQLLQAFAAGEQQPPLYFYAFDLLRLNGTDLRRRPLLDRKEALRGLLDQAPSLLRYSAPLGRDASRLLSLVSSLDLEGLIGKRPESLYEEGSRTGSWIKLKVRQDADLVIGGYTLPEGRRQHLGALLLGYLENGRLRFAGKVGSGFSRAVLRRLIGPLRASSTAACPFVDFPETKRSRWGQALTPAEMKRCRWVRPTLVCRVRFTEWTRDGKLRQPVFDGLRPDKFWEGVGREEVTEVAN